MKAKEPIRFVNEKIIAYLLCELSRNQGPKGMRQRPPIEQPGVKIQVERRQARKEHVWMRPPKMRFYALSMRYINPGRNVSKSYGNCLDKSFLTVNSKPFRLFFTKNNLMAGTHSL